MALTQKEINDRWTKGSENYDRIIHDELESFRVEGWRKLISAQTGDRPGLEVLDCGCGPAFFTIILARAGCRVTGIDAAEGMLDKARRNVEEFGVDARILEMDCHSLDFPDGSFDAVVSRNVTHALRDHARVYTEWYRVLRPGGKLTVFDGNFYLYAHDPAYESMNVERHIEIYHKDEPDCRERLLRVADMATKLPASKDRRPQWDMNQLVCLGAERVSAVSYPENRIEITENGKRSYLPFTFAVSGFKG